MKIRTIVAAPSTDDGSLPKGLGPGLWAASKWVRDAEGKIVGSYTTGRIVKVDVIPARTIAEREG